MFLAIKAVYFLKEWVQQPEKEAEVMLISLGMTQCGPQALNNH